MGELSGELRFWNTQEPGRPFSGHTVVENPVRERPSDPIAWEVLANGSLIAIQDEVARPGEREHELVRIRQQEAQMKQLLRASADPAIIAARQRLHGVPEHPGTMA